MDGFDNDCEKLGWKRIYGYDPCGRGWKYLTYLAKGNPRGEDFLNEDELVDDDYFPSLPFAALFSCCKVPFMLMLSKMLIFLFFVFLLQSLKHSLAHLY